MPESKKTKQRKFRERNLDTEHVKRRQFIFRRAVLDNRPLSLTEMREVLNLVDYDEVKIDGDIQHFKTIGCNIALLPSRSDPNENEFMFLEGPHTDNDDLREKTHVEEKRLVARVTASLICGVPAVSEELTLPPWINDARKVLERMTIHSVENGSVVGKNGTPGGDLPEASSETPAEDEQMRARIRSVLTHLDEKLEMHRNANGIDPVEQVLKLLRYKLPFLHTRLDALRTNLYDFWEESSRLVAIDSGTTNIILSHFLKQLHIPLVGSRLCSLTVCTNSRRIFEELGPSNVWIRTIIIGGQQMFRRSTIAGAMAELFLRSVPNLQFGMCILGSTRVDLDRFTVCSDSQEESSLKNLLMDRSALRIIAVDNFKLQSGPGREGYRFASIDPKHIDLIVTNSPLKNGAKANAEYDSFITKVQAIEHRGVPVIVATSPLTFDYPKAR